MSGPYRWKGALQFGAIQFNVIAKSAVKEGGVSFNRHHSGDPFCGGRLRQGPMICEIDGSEVEKEDQVRGFNGVSPVDEDYLESLERERSASMKLDALVPAAQIDPRYFQKSYDLTPDRGSEQAYVLMREVLVAEDRYALGKIGAGGKEYIVAIRPRGHILVMEFLYWPEEIVPSVEAETALFGFEVPDALIQQGRKLAALLARDFAPDQYRNEYIGEVQAYLDQLVAGEAPAPIVAAPRKSPGHQSLEDALAQSLAMLGPVDEKPAKPAKKKKAA